MTKGDKTSWLILGASVLAMVAAVGVFVSSLAEGPIVDEVASVRRMASEPVASSVESPKSKRTPIVPETIARVPRPSDNGLSSATNRTEAAGVAKDDTDELMDEVVKEIMAQLQDAMRKRDVKGILALAEKLRALRYGAKSSGGGGSASVKRTLLSALAGCGVEAIPEIVNLVNDPDVAIAQTATSLVFETLKDSSLSDSVRADIVVEAASEMEDVNSLIRLYNEFIKMRHSVGVDAFVRISSGGTSEAQEQLPRVISAFTGNPSITTADKLNDWLSNHPDGKNDNKRYGGIKFQGAQTE